MAANNPKHGDAIIRAAPDALGGTKLIATRQFQQFLDQLGTAVDSSSDSDIQSIASLNVQLGHEKARTSVNTKSISDLFQQSASLTAQFGWQKGRVSTHIKALADLFQQLATVNTENGRLKAVIQRQRQDFEGLEQEFYGS